MIENKCRFEWYYVGLFLVLLKFLEIILGCFNNNYLSFFINDDDFLL